MQFDNHSILIPDVSFYQDINTTPNRIDFKRISGDLKQEDGNWVLASAADAATIVEYELYVDPGFWIPRVLLRHSLRAELPAALTAVRERAESTVANR